MKKIIAGDIPLLPKETRLAIIGEYLARQRLRHSRKQAALMIVAPAMVGVMEFFVLPGMFVGPQPDTVNFLLRFMPWLFVLLCVCCTGMLVYALFAFMQARKDLACDADILRTSGIDTSGLSDDDVFYRGLLPQMRHQGWTIDEIDRRYSQGKHW